MSSGRLIQADSREFDAVMCVQNPWFSKLLGNDGDALQALVETIVLLTDFGR